MWERKSEGERRLTRLVGWVACGFGALMEFGIVFRGTSSTDTPGLVHFRLFSRRDSRRRIRLDLAVLACGAVNLVAWIVEGLAQDLRR